MKGSVKMEKLKVNGYLLEVDYAEELELYMDRFERARIRGEKVQACSPFRNEKNPSFAVNLDNGSWVDSGADSESERKGSFVSLLAHFRGESYEDTSEYLLEKYCHILDDADSLKLKMNLSMEDDVVLLHQEKYEDVVGKPSEYLRNRKISDEVQKLFNCGIGRKGDSVTIPWHDKHGRIINVKYRSMKGKEFWFSKGGQPIKNHVYGIWLIRLKKIKEIWAVESEIDALYLWSLGIPAIAFGGASMNETQKKLILNSGIESLVIATDNDVVGQRFGEVLAKELNGYIVVKKICFPNEKKDVNDLSENEVKHLFNNISFCNIFN